MIRSTQVGPYKLYAEDRDGKPEGPTVDITGRKILDLGVNFEPHVYRELARLLPGAQCFLDIGCNVGLYTIAAKALRPELPIVSIDVSHFNCQMLLRSIVENKLDKIRVLNVALADTERIIQISNNVINPVLGTLGSRDGTPSALATLGRWDDTGWEYRYAFPLDMFDVAKCNVVKMDIDGFEYLALLGARNLMAQRPNIVFEYVPSVTVRSGLKSPVELLQLFIDQNYSLTVLDYIPGIRKEFVKAQDCHDHVIQTTQSVSDILATPL